MGVAPKYLRSGFRNGFNWSDNDVSSSQLFKLPSGSMLKSEGDLNADLSVFTCTSYDRTSSFTKGYERGLLYCSIGLEDSLSPSTIRSSVAMLDSGAVSSFISKRLATRLDLSTISKSNNLEVTLADESVILVTEHTKVHVHCGYHVDHLQLEVLPLDTECLILGLDWMRRAEALLDPRNCKLHFTDFSDSVPLHTQAPSVSLSHLSSEVRCLDTERENRLRTEFAYVFSETPPTDNSNIPVQHYIIEEPNSSPPYQRPYKLPEHEARYLQNYFKELEDLGFIYRTDSPYSAPVFLVLKQDGVSYRPVINYGLLNQQTVKARYPLPLQSDILNKMRGSRVFSVLDLSSGYFHVPVAPESQHKTAMSTPFGQFAWTRLPMGLCNAPATFQKMIDHIFADIKDMFVQVFLDDVAVYSPSLEEHEKHLHLVLSRLLHYGLSASPKKSHLFVSSINYLGYEIDKHGIRPNTAKIHAVKKWKEPTSQKELSRFLGFANWFRDFVPNFARISKPLYELSSSKSKQWKWTTTHQEAFESLISHLCSPPVLAFPDPNQEFFLATDASDYQVGSVLLQKYAGKYKPIGYHSENIKRKSFTASHHELYAIRSALDNWQHLLKDSYLEIWTDHADIPYMLSKRNLDRQAARLITKLDDLHLWSHRVKIYYQKPSSGSLVALADALSRRPSLDGPFSYSNGFSQQPTASSLSSVGFFTLVSRGNITNLFDVSDYLQDLCFSSSSWLSTHEIRRDPDTHYYFKWFPRFNTWLLAVPRSRTAIGNVIRVCHDAMGHRGRTATVDRILRSFWWQGCRRDLAEYIQGCVVCQHCKFENTYPQGPLVPLPIPDRPFSSVAMDFVGPLPPTPNGKDFCLIVVDRLTKWVVYIPCQSDVTAESTAQLCWEKVFCDKGLPSEIVSDKGSIWTSRFWRGLSRAMEIRLNQASVAHPQADGQAERAVGDFLSVLRSLVHHRPESWENFVSLAQFVHNSSYCEPLGCSPFQALYGYAPREFPLPSGPSFDSYVRESLPTWVQKRISDIHDFRSNVQRILERNREKMKRKVDAFRRMVDISPGDHVLVDVRGRIPIFGNITQKFSPIYLGPWKVHRALNDVTFELELPQDWGISPVFHASKLKKFIHSDARTFPSQPRGRLHGQPYYSDIEEELELDMIVDKVVYKPNSHRRTVWYKVLWMFYDPEEASWVKFDDIIDSATVEEYEELQESEKYYLSWLFSDVPSYSVQYRKNQAQIENQAEYSRAHPVPRSRRSRQPHTG